MSSPVALLHQLAIEAGTMIRAGFGERQYEFKARQDYLTASDTAIERHIRAAVKAQFPDHEVLGEEEGGNPDAERLWVLDPIDGTANFARGIPHCCISLAFREGGQTRFGAIFDPFHDELFFAEREQGAFCNDRRIQVSPVARLDEACVEIGWSAAHAGQYMASMEAAIEAGCVIRRANSGALAMAYVADGRCEAFINAHTQAWDCAAGLLLVQEAGGRVSDFWQPETMRQGNCVLSTNACLAEPLAAIAGISLLAVQ